MGREQIEAIRRNNPIETVVGRYVALRRSGRNLRARCPFHDDRHPSFYLYLGTQSFYCFGCGAYGDVFSFVMRIENVDFSGALEWLSETKAEPTARPAAPSLQVLRPSKQLDDEHAAVLTAAAGFYHRRFLANERAREVVRRRGIDDEIADRCWIGYAPGRGLRGALRAEGFDLRLAQEVGLLRPRGEHLAGRIVVPALLDDRALFLIGRAARRGQEPKYLGLPIPKPLYGVGMIRDRAEAWLTEGVFDWLTLLTWGYPAVALLGTRLKRELHGQLDHVSHIYLVLDSDEEGRAGAARLQVSLGSRARTITLPPGVKDVNELARQPAGRETFAWLAEIARASEQRAA